MLPPNICYAWPLLKDTSTQPLELLHRTLSLTTDGFGGYDGIFYTIPSDKVLILSSFIMVGTVGGGGGYAAIYSDYGASGVFDYEAIVGARSNAANVQMAPWSGEVWISGGKSLYLAVSHGAAAAANYTTTIFGILVPRGSVSYA